MAWNKKHYKEIKEFTAHWLSHRPFHEVYKGTPISHVDFMLTQIPIFLKAQDFEAAKAIKDAIIEFWNYIYHDNVPKEALLRLPEWKEPDLPPHHISYVRCKRSGM